MANSPSARSHRWVLFGCLLTIFVAQVQLSNGTEFLDSDDWFLIHMGRTTVDTPVSDWLDPLTRFWSEEPTWRPLSVLLSTAEWKICGENAHARVAFHCLLHALCAGFIFFLVSHWFQSEKTGLWAAILYAAHPIHAQSLAWFHAGFESIPITLVTLVTLWLFTRKKPVWVILLTFQLAMFFRENALCIPFLIAAMAWSRETGPRRIFGVLRQTAPYWILLAVNTIIRIWMVHYEQSHQADLLKSFHVTDSPFSALATVLVQPFTPVHPSINNASIWWWSFVLIAGGGLVAHIRWGSRAVIKRAGLFFILASLPFVLQIHEPPWSDQSLLDNTDPRWYFYHLSVAGIVAWLAAIFSTIKRWGPPILGTLVVVFLILQSMQIQWWASRGDLVRSVASVTDSPAGTAIGLVVPHETGSSDLAEQVFLNRSLRMNTTPENAPVYKASMLPTQTRSIATMSSREEIRWSPVNTTPKGVIWWRWSEKYKTAIPLTQETHTGIDLQEIK